MACEWRGGVWSSLLEPTSPRSWSSGPAPVSSDLTLGSLEVPRKARRLVTGRGRTTSLPHRCAGSTAGHDVCSDRRAKKPRNGVLWRASGRCWATAEVLCWRTSSGPAGCSAQGGGVTTVSAVGAGALYAVAGRVSPWLHLG